MNHAVLLGDSIFDNAAYVPGKPSVIEQLRKTLPGDWKATLLAVDGDVTADVQHQIERLPDDALGHSSILDQSAGSVKEVLEYFTSVRTSFQQTYRKMIQTLKGLNKNLAVCTVYDCVPGYKGSPMTALALFNEINQLDRDMLRGNSLWHWLKHYFFPAKGD